MGDVRKLRRAIETILAADEAGRIALKVGTVVDLERLLAILRAMEGRE